MSRTIAIANDHGGVEMKNELKKRLEAQGHTVINVGTDTTGAVDYPDMAELGCREVLEGRAEFAILICGTGIGISIAANKIDGIRAALCADTFSARMSKEHNDANAIAFGARTTGIELVWEMVQAYMRSEFQHAQHTARVDKINTLSHRYCCRS